MSVRLALAQVNPCVGDLAGNSALIREVTERAVAEGAQIVAFPEMALTGYPVEDLALRRSFQRAAQKALEQLAVDLQRLGLGDVLVIVGSLGTDHDGRATNCAGLLRGGVVEQIYVKHHLPNYGVFDEHRLFSAGSQPCVFAEGGVRFSLAICEDIWHSDSPAQQAATTDADVFLIINASPFEQNKFNVRRQLCADRAAETNCIVAYVNQVGGQDELVFDGGSMLVSPDGELLAGSVRFAEDILLVDLPDDTDTAITSERIALPDRDHWSGPFDVGITDTEGPGELYAALVLGLHDYVTKNGVESVVVGISGGIDSALVAALAVDALGPNNVHGVMMPSQYSSEHSVADAQGLAERTGLAARKIPIAPMFDAYQDALNLTGLAEENLQARIRGAILMAISNSEGHLVLAPGNKSELAVGYSTIYGDAVGGFGPIKDVPKTLVWQLARWRNQWARDNGKTEPIPPNSIEKPPSAELRPGQLDTDSLPDYAELDAVLTGYIENMSGTEELVAAGYDSALATRILRMTDFAEYKRRQYPPGTKITKVAFGRDRRLPITNRWREPDIS